MGAAPLLLIWASVASADALPVPPADGGIRVDSIDAIQLGDGGFTADGGVPARPSPADKSPNGGARTTVRMRFRNNRVMAEEVYRAILQLPRDAGVNRPTAFAIRTQLESFLQQCGYELATVSTAVAADAAGPLIDVDINEGLLEKVVFRGKFTFKTLRFKLALQLPYDIFNRPELERQIRALSVELDLGRVWYELVPTREVKHLAPQVESLGQLGDIQGYQLIHPREPYELHVFFEEKSWDTGAWLDLRTGPIDGLEVIGVKQSQGFLADDDRVKFSISGGGGLRNPIANPADPKRLFLVPELYPTFSRAYTEAIYYASVPLIRPLLEARAELVSRQRKDLNVENYYNLNTDALISAEYEFRRKQTITFGAGERYQRVFDVVAGPGGVGDSPGGVITDIASITSLEDNKKLFRTFAELRLDLLFSDGNDRWDRRDALTAEARQFLSGDAKAFGEARVGWQRVFPFGWDDLWIKAHGAYLYGEVPFTNEEALNNHIRNVFGNIYVDWVGSESTEVRFSLTRDIFKVSFFNDVGVFGFPTQGRHPAVGDSFGPGFHVLAQGMFQIDMYYGVGLSSVSGYRFDNGFSLNLQKVF